MAKKDTEIATRPEAALAPSQGLGIEGMEALDRDDLVLPRIQLVQGLSAAATDGIAPPGKFVSNLGGVVYDRIRIVPLLITKGRVWFEKGKDKHSCRSADGMVPRKDVEAPPAEMCCVREESGRLREVCDKAKWAGRSNPPPCSSTYNIVALDLETKSPFCFGAKGHSYKPVKRIISYCAARGRSPFSIACTMQAVKRTNVHGTFFVLDFTEFEELEPADQYYSDYQAVRGFDTQQTDEDLPF